MGGGGFGGLQDLAGVVYETAHKRLIGTTCKDESC